MKEGRVGIKINFRYIRESYFKIVREGRDGYKRSLLFISYYCKIVGDGRGGI